MYYEGEHYKISLNFEFDWNVISGTGTRYPIRLMELQVSFKFNCNLFVYTFSYTSSIKMIFFTYQKTWYMQNLIVISLLQIRAMNIFHLFWYSTKYHRLDGCQQLFDELFFVSGMQKIKYFNSVHHPAKFQVCLYNPFTVESGNVSKWTDGQTHEMMSTPIGADGEQGLKLHSGTLSLFCNLLCGRPFVAKGEWH